jgi:hypothetical protein
VEIRINERQATVKSMRDEMRMLALVLGVALIGATACGGEDGAPAPDRFTGFEGVYQLETATQNPAACDVEGPSVRDTFLEAQFVAVGLKPPIGDGLQLISCRDDGACLSVAAQAKSGGIFDAPWGRLLNESAAAGQLAGLSASGGFHQNGTCVERTYTALTLIGSGDALRLEARTTELDDIPADNGTCPAEPAKQRAEAAALPCSSLDVLTGNKRAPLP